MQQRIKGKILKAGFEGKSCSGLGVFCCYCHCFGWLVGFQNKKIQPDFDPQLGWVVTS